MNIQDLEEERQNYLNGNVTMFFNTHNPNIIGCECGNRFPLNELHKHTHEKYIKDTLREIEMKIYVMYLKNQLRLEGRKDNFYYHKMLNNNIP